MTADPRDVARAILADPRYHAVKTTRKQADPTLLERLAMWLGDRLHELFRGIHHSLGTHLALGVVVSVILSVLLVAVLAFAIVRIARRRARGAGRPGATPGSESLAMQRTAHELRSAARAALAGGSARAAAALFYASAVRALAEGGRLREDPARTPGDYRRQLRDPAFDVFARDAVAAVYGADEPSHAAVEQIDAEYDRAVACA